MSTKDKEVTLFGEKETLPAHLQSDMNQGNENVTADDVAIPRLKLIQKGSTEFEEVGAGVFLNTISNEAYKAPYVVNLHYSKEYAVFKDRNLGTEFQGTFSTEDEAKAHIETLPRPEDYNITPTARHVLLLLDDTGEPIQPIIYNMTGTAMQVSKMWNSQILTKGKNGPRHGTVWQLNAKMMSNNKGSWYVPDPVYMGFASAELFEEVARFYDETKAA